MSVSYIYGFVSVLMLMLMPMLLLVAMRLLIHGAAHARACREPRHGARTWRIRCRWSPLSLHADAPAPGSTAFTLTCRSFSMGWRCSSPLWPLPPPPHLQLPIVTSNDFAPYLKAVSSSLAKFEQNHPQAQGTCDAGPLVGSSDKLADGGGGGGASILDLTCLQHVPDVFRSKHFDLKSPSTFAAVFGCPADLDSAGGGYDDDGDALLEQLHSHLDDVEAALMLGVRSRSSEFFAAVDELQLLSLDIASALQDTAVARTALATVDREVVGSALQVY